MDVNPDLVQGIIVYNLLDKDFVKQYFKAVCNIRCCLTSKGDQVGPFKTCGADPNDPVFKLTLQAKSTDATTNLETHLLIYKGDGNSYWFFAGGQWRRCSDSNDTGVSVSGVVDEANFNSKKEGFVVKEIGPGTIYEALQGFASGKSNWENHFRLLSFMFLDAARFNTVLDFVVKTFEAATDLKNHKQTVDDFVAKCPVYWKSLSNSMYNLFPDYSLGKSSFWLLSSDVICDLKLASYNPPLTAFKQRERINRDDMIACFAIIHVLCPASLIVYDDDEGGYPYI